DPVAGHLARAAYWAHRKDGASQAKARAEYAAVTSAAPSQVAPYLEAADYFQKRNDVAGLRDAVAGAARADGNAPELAYYRGVLAALQAMEPAPHAPGSFDEAEQLLKGYVRTVPPRSDRPSQAAAHEWLGRVFETTGRTAQAAGEYREALRLEPKRESA